MRGWRGNLKPALRSGAHNIYCNCDDCSHKTWKEAGDLSHPEVTDEIQMRFFWSELEEMTNSS